MKLLKILLAQAHKRSETPADRRRRLLREAFTPNSLKSRLQSPLQSTLAASQRQTRTGKH